MITKRYVTIFLVGSCLLLDHSSQIPLQTSLHNRTSRGAITFSGGGRKNLSLRPSLGEVPSVEGKRRWRRQGRLGTHRIKRGWVWNQFFVVEEYTGTEPLYVGKVRHYDSLHKYMKNLVNRCQFLELLVVKRKRKECLSMQLRYG